MPVKKKAAKRKPAAKKTVRKAAPKKKTTTRKTAAKKTVRKAAPKKKAAAKRKPAAKKRVVKKAAPKKKTTAKKTTARKTTRKAATKRTTAKKTVKKATTKKKATKRKPNAAFMRPMELSAELQAIVGKKPLPRTQVTKKLWAYIKKHDLQDLPDIVDLVADEQARGRVERRYAVTVGIGTGQLVERPDIVVGHDEQHLRVDRVILHFGGTAGEFAAAIVDPVAGQVRIERARCRLEIVRLERPALVSCTARAATAVVDRGKV